MTRLMPARHRTARLLRVLVWREPGNPLWICRDSGLRRQFIPAVEILRSKKCPRIPLLPGAVRGSARSVHKILSRPWQVIVDHDGNTLDMQSSAPHIGGHQHIDLSAGKSIERTAALSL